jgi:hypothetical protein
MPGSRAGSAGAILSWVLEVGREERDRQAGGEDVGGGEARGQPPIVGPRAGLPRLPLVSASKRARFVGGRPGAPRPYVLERIGRGDWI